MPKKSPKTKNEKINVCTLETQMSKYKVDFKRKGNLKIRIKTPVRTKLKKSSFLINTVPPRELPMCSGKTPSASPGQGITTPRRFVWDWKWVMLEAQVCICSSDGCNLDYSTSRATRSYFPRIGTDIADNTNTNTITNTITNTNIITSINTSTITSTNTSTKNTRW